MPRDLMSWGAAWLTDQVKAHASAEVTYRRGEPGSAGAASVTFDALMDNPILRVTDHLGQTRVERTRLDFRFPAASLVLAGAVTTPERGDYVDVTVGSITHRYEVTPADRNEPCWRYTDPYRTQILARAKFLREV